MTRTFLVPPFPCHSFTRYSVSVQTPHLSDRLTVISPPRGGLAANKLATNCVACVEDWEQVKYSEHNNPLVDKGYRLRSRLILGE